MNLAENIKHPPQINGILRRYYAVWMTYALAGGFLFGVYPIFLHARGLNQFEINSVLAMYFVVLFLTDVPTGAFADALGRRRSFVLGAALRVCAFLLYFTAHHYWVFLIAESIDGIGTTFGNGAIDAWGVDALDDAGYEGLKDGLFSRISQLTTVGFMISSLGGAYVADINIAWPWLCGAAGYVMAAVIGVWLMTGEKTRASGVDFAGLPQSDRAARRRGCQRGFQQSHRAVPQRGGRDSIRGMGAVLARMADSVQPELWRRRVDHRMDLLRAVDCANARRRSGVAHDFG